MTYLELVQYVARISESVDPRVIASVDTTNNRVARIAALVSESWTQIQNMYRGWRFLVRYFPDDATLVEGVSEVTGATLGLNNWDGWIFGTAEDTFPMTVWKASGDGGDELQLYRVDYNVFRQSYRRGTSRDRTGRPQAASETPDEHMVVWPTPDEDYRIDGAFYRSPQILANDGDVPIIAEQFHTVIARAAKVLLDHSDEAPGDVLLGDIQLPITLDAQLEALRRRYLNTDVSLSRDPVGGSNTQGYGSLTSGGWEGTYGREF